MCISNFTPQIEPGTLPSARASTTLRRTVPFFRCNRPAGIFVKKLNSASEPDSHDGRNPQAKDQNGEQQHAAPHAAHADEDADDKANQDFGDYQRHSCPVFGLCVTLLPC